MSINDLGFNYTAAGAHIRRTLMVADLQELLKYVTDNNAPYTAYYESIVSDNCLGKNSIANRKITATNLKYLYALDDKYPIWHAFRLLYEKDNNSLPLLALLCALGRDELLRAYLPFILSKEIGITILRAETEKFYEETFPGRFSPAMLKSLAQNINGSYTLSGHLRGRTKKIRNKPAVTPAAVVYAVYLGALQGKRGLSLFDTEFVQILEVNNEEAIGHLQIASQRGWVNLKHMGDVLEVNFPDFKY